MYISYSWLKELVDFSYTTEELDHILTMLGIEVEEVIDYQKKYDKFFTASVLKVEKHPNADKLTVCEVDYGQGVNKVVCGAPNVEAGQKVILGIPGAVIPGAGFTLEKRTVRNIESAGMICSESELETGEDSNGIWVLPKETEIGKSLSDFLELNDIIMDVSLTPNKADCLSHIGIAREISAYNGNPVNIPKTNITESGKAITDSMEVIIEDAEKCPRYSARIIRGITVKESPVWLKNRLILLGLRPVNVIVDITNFVLMEQGQPLHAFDLNKIEGNKIICKTVKDTEKFTTLDSKERTLDSSMLMICDANRSVAIGGVMGGGNSEIADETKDVLLESALFNPSSIRKTSKQLGIQSDASYRFERGVDIENVTNALDRAAALIAELTGGTIDKGFIDVYPNPIEKLKLKMRYQRANDVIGIDISSDEMKNMLQRLRFNIVDENDTFCTVEVPYSRVDVSQEIDLIEEIARLYNYDNIEPDYSISVSLASGSVPAELTIPPLRGKISDYLIKSGFNEIITQNMMDPATADLFTDNPIKISNPLGEELSVMRPSIIPAVLRTIGRNIRLGNGDLKFFEIGRSFHVVDENQETFIKNLYEKEEIIIALSGKTMPQQWGVQDKNADFYDIKGIVEELTEFFRLSKVKYKHNETDNTIFNKNSMEIIANGDSIGKFGEVSNDLLKRFEIEVPVYLGLLNLSMLYKSEREIPYYSQVPPYPGIARDLGFIVDKSLTAKEIQNEIMNKGGNLLKSSVVFDVYEGKSIEKGKKSIAYSLNFSSPKRTLKDEEVDITVDKIVHAVEKKFNARLRKF
ncbi:phenylalanine--tRNA ligase subunit beta [Bacteroidota bacterium]